MIIARFYYPGNPVLQVMSATFARFHPNLILGGTYSGQVVLWDNRVQKRTPVQRSPLSAAAHTHPVLSLVFFYLFWEQF